MSSSSANIDADGWASMPLDDLGDDDDDLVDNEGRRTGSNPRLSNSYYSHPFRGQQQQQQVENEEPITVAASPLKPSPATKPQQPKALRKHSSSDSGSGNASEPPSQPQHHQVPMEEVRTVAEGSHAENDNDVSQAIDIINLKHNNSRSSIDNNNDSMRSTNSSIQDGSATHNNHNTIVENSDSSMDFAAFFGGREEEEERVRPQTTQELMELQEKKRAAELAAERERERLKLEQQREEFLQQDLQKRKTILDELESFQLPGETTATTKNYKTDRNDSSSLLDMNDLDSQIGFGFTGEGKQRPSSDTTTTDNTQNNNNPGEQQQILSEEQRLAQQDEQRRAKEEEDRKVQETLQKRQDELRLQQEFRQVIQRSLYGRASTAATAAPNAKNNNATKKPRKSVRFQMDNETDDEHDGNHSKEFKKHAKSAATKKVRRDTRRHSASDPERLTQSFSDLDQGLDGDDDKNQGEHPRRRGSKQQQQQQQRVSKSTGRKSTITTTSDDPDTGEPKQRRKLLRRNSSDGDLQRMREGSGRIRRADKRPGSLRASRTTGASSTRDGVAAPQRRRTTHNSGAGSLRASRTTASSGETTATSAGGGDVPPKRRSGSSRTTRSSGDATAKPPPVSSSRRPQTPGALKRESLSEQIAASLAVQVAPPKVADDEEPKPSRRKLLRKNSSCGDLEDMKASRRKKKPEPADSKIPTTAPSTPKASKGKSRSERGTRRSVDMLILDNFDSSNLDIDMLLQTTLTTVGTRARDEEQQTTPSGRRKLLRRNSSDGDLQPAAANVRKSRKPTTRQSLDSAAMDALHHCLGSLDVDNKGVPSSPQEEEKTESETVQMRKGQEKTPKGEGKNGKEPAGTERAKRATKKHGEEGSSGGGRRKLLRKNSSEGDLATRERRKTMRSRKNRASVDAPRMKHSSVAFDQADLPEQTEAAGDDGDSRKKSRHKSKELSGGLSTEGGSGRRKLLRKNSSEGLIDPEGRKSRKSRKPKAKEEPSLRLNQSMNNLDFGAHWPEGVHERRELGPDKVKTSSKTPLRDEKPKLSYKVQAGSQLSEQSPDVTASTTVTPTSPQEETRKRPSRRKVLRRNSSDGDLAKMRQSGKERSKGKSRKKNIKDRDDGPATDQALHQSLSLFEEVEEALHQRKSKSLRGTRSADEGEPSPARRKSHDDIIEKKDRSKRIHGTTLTASNAEIVTVNEQGDAWVSDTDEVEAPRVKPIITKLSLCAKNKANLNDVEPPEDKESFHQSFDSFGLDEASPWPTRVFKSRRYLGDFRRCGCCRTVKIENQNEKDHVDSENEAAVEDNTSVSSLEFPPISTKERTAKSRRFEQPLDGVDVPPIPTSIALSVADETQGSNTKLEKKLKTRWTTKTYFDERSQSEVIDLASSYASLDLPTKRQAPTPEERRHSSLTALALDASVINGHTKRYQRIRDSLVASGVGRGWMKSVTASKRQAIDDEGDNGKNDGDSREDDDSEDEEGMSLKWKRRLTAHVLLKEVAKGKHLAVTTRKQLLWKKKAHERAVKNIHDNSRALFSELTEQKRQEQPQENFWDVVAESYEVNVGDSPDDTVYYHDVDDDISSALPVQTLSQSST